MRLANTLEKIPLSLEVVQENEESLPLNIRKICMNPKCVFWEKIVWLCIIRQNSKAWCYLERILRWWGLSWYKAEEEELQTDLKFTIFGPLEKQIRDTVLTRIASWKHRKDTKDCYVSIRECVTMASSRASSIGIANHITPVSSSSLVKISSRERFRYVATMSNEKSVMFSLWLDHQVLWIPRRGRAEMAMPYLDVKVASKLSPANVTRMSFDSWVCSHVLKIIIHNKRQNLRVL